MTCSTKHSIRDICRWLRGERVYFECMNGYPPAALVAANLERGKVLRAVADKLATLPRYDEKPHADAYTGTSAPAPVLPAAGTLPFWYGLRTKAQQDRLWDYYKQVGLL